MVHDFVCKLNFSWAIDNSKENLTSLKIKVLVASEKRNELGKHITQISSCTRKYSMLKSDIVKT